MYSDGRNPSCGRLDGFLCVCVSFQTVLQLIAYTTLCMCAVISLVNYVEAFLGLSRNILNYLI